MLDDLTVAAKCRMHAFVMLPFRPTVGCAGPPQPGQQHLPDEQVLEKVGLFTIDSVIRRRRLTHIWTLLDERQRALVGLMEPWSEACAPWPVEVLEDLQALQATDPYQVSLGGPAVEAAGWRDLTANMSKKDWSALTTKILTRAPAVRQAEIRVAQRPEHFATRPVAGNVRPQRAPSRPPLAKILVCAPTRGSVPDVAGGQQVFCPCCPADAARVFDTTAALFSHLHSRHGHIKPQRLFALSHARCPGCAKKYADRKKLVDHLYRNKCGTLQKLKQYEPVSLEELAVVDPRAAELRDRQLEVLRG